MFCWHNWDKWSMPNNGILAAHEGAIGYFAVCQTRVCRKCGIAEVRKLPTLRSLAELKNER